jgi:hypothetical protein
LVLAMFMPARNTVGNGWAYALLFVVPQLGALPVYYYWLPETKGRSVIEVQRGTSRALPKLSLLKLIPKIPCLKKKKSSRQKRSFADGPFRFRNRI